MLPRFETNPRVLFCRKGKLEAGYLLSLLVASLATSLSAGGPLAICFLPLACHYVARDQFLLFQLLHFHHLQVWEAEIL
jgi:hypothetical protein